MTSGPGARANRLPWALLVLLVGSLLAAGAAGWLLWRSLTLPTTSSLPDQPVALIVPTIPPAPTTPPTRMPAPLPTLPPLILPTASGAPVRSEAEIVREAMLSVVQVRAAQSLGTGFVARQQGSAALVVTNAHVIETAEQVAVIAPDGAEHAGQVLRRDDMLDLAIIAVPTLTDLTPLPLGDTTNVRAGDPLYVIGFALSDTLLGDPTVTRGVVSGRRVVREVDYLQTDAAMNPGASGGPVLDNTGRIVGVATWGLRDPRGRQTQNINFAVPVELVRQMADQIGG